VEFITNLPLLQLWMALIVDEADITMSKAAKMLKFSRLTLAGPDIPEQCEPRRFTASSSSKSFILVILALLNDSLSANLSSFSVLALIDR
jgi:hypothetical protein